MKISEKALRRFWAKVALPNENGCMLWTGARIRNGYGHMKADESFQLAHRLSLHLAVGEPPSNLSQAAHSCRNRHCVAPAHLRWATAAENTADKYRDGTVLAGDRHPNALLANTQVIELRQLYAEGITRVELRDRFGINRKLLNEVLSGRRYREALPKAGA